MRVVWWGTYDTSKPRTRILLDGLSSAGVEIIEIHASVWEDVRDKSSRTTCVAILSRALRWLFAYPRLIAKYLAAPDHDAVIVGYLGQIDVVVLWPFARLRGKPIVWDAFVSLYNTIVEDRRLLRPSHPFARAVKALEAVACRCADRVLLDTSAHAGYFARTYQLPDARFGKVFVGAEQIFVDAGRKPRLQNFRERPQILFYGQFIPLHGLDVLVEAAASERGRAYDWVIIGEGQEAKRIDQRLEALALPHVRRVRWIAYEKLADIISESDIGLGIFSADDKAGLVIPNKVFQILAVGQRLVTRDSPAMRELVGPPSTDIALVAPASPEALLDGVEQLLASPASGRAAPDILDCIAPQAIGRSLKTEVEVAIASHRGSRR